MKPNDIYDHYFQGPVPKFEMNLIDQTVNQFIKGIETESRPIFELANRWNFLYYFLGEMYSNCKEAGVMKTSGMEFFPKEGHIDVDYKMLFSIAIYFKRSLAKVYPIKGSGLPDWLKHEDYGVFWDQIQILLSKKHLRAVILQGRPVTVRYFKNREEVFEFLGKGNLSKMIDETIEICKKRSPGTWTKRKIFRDRESFDKTVELFYSDIEAHNGPKMKKMRITKRKCAKYLLYLGLMGTIQTRIGEAVGLKARDENDFFTYYKVFRDSAIRLGWMVATDHTYCPGIRVKSFIVKVMCKPVEIAVGVLHMNKIELAFMKIEPSKRRAFAGFYGVHAYDYLMERMQMKYKEEDAFLLRRDNRKLGGAIHAYGATNGSKWVGEKLSEIRSNQHKFQMHYVDLHHYITKWSSERTHKWFLAS